MDHRSLNSIIGYSIDFMWDTFSSQQKSTIRCMFILLSYSLSGIRDQTHKTIHSLKYPYNTFENLNLGVLSTIWTCSLLFVKLPYFPEYMGLQANRSPWNTTLSLKGEWTKKKIYFDFLRAATNLLEFSNSCKVVLIVLPCKGGLGWTI